MHYIRFPTLAATEPASRIRPPQLSSSIADIGFGARIPVYPKMYRNMGTRDGIGGKAAVYARAALEWGIRALARAVLISHDTVIRFERGEELRDKTIDAIREAFERHGVVFIAENGGGAGVRLAKAKKRKR